MQFNIIYKTTNLINGKIYVGKHTQYETSAFDGYLGSGLLISRAIKKYGKENFIRETLEILFTEESVFKREELWINRLSSTDLDIGYNLLEHGGGVTSEYSKQLWENKEVRELILNRRREVISREDYKIRRSEISKEVSSRPWVKEKFINTLRNYYSFELNLAKRSELSKEINNRLDVRQKKSLAMKKKYEDPIFKEEHRQRSIEISSLPEVKDVWSLLIKRVSRKNWDNPEFKEKAIRSIKEAQNRVEVSEKKSKRMMGNQYGLGKPSRAIFYYVFKDPTGNIWETDNLFRFSNEHGLKFKNMSAVANRKRNHYRGWTSISKVLRNH